MGELNNPLYRIFLTREIYSLHEKKIFLSRGKNIPFVGVYFAKWEIPLQMNKKGEPGSPLYHYHSIGLTKHLRRLCCSVRKYSHCACTLPFSSNSGLLSAYS